MVAYWVEQTVMASLVAGERQRVEQEMAEYLDTNEV